MLPTEIIHIPFEMSPETRAMLDSGDARLHGQTVRDTATGKIITHLRPVNDTAKAAVQGVAEQAPSWLASISDKSDVFTKNFLQAMKINPGISIILAGGAVIGISMVGVVMTKNAQKRRSQKNLIDQESSSLHEVVIHLDSAINNWLEVVNQDSLTAEIVNNFAEAYETYLEVTTSNSAVLKGLDESRQNFYANFARYAAKVAEANGVETGFLGEPSNVIDLTPHIAVQQKEFPREVA